MKIDHIAVYVEDLERARAFYEKYFGGNAGEKYHNPRTGFTSYFLRFETGCRLEIMNKHGLPKPQALERLGFIHISFNVGSKEEVDYLTDRLQTDGYKVISGPRTTGDGYYESQILDPVGNIIEITE